MLRARPFNDIIKLIIVNNMIKGIINCEYAPMAFGVVSFRMPVYIDKQGGIR